MRTISDVLTTTGANPESGLSPEAVVSSRQKFGENKLTPLPREPLWKKFIEKFDDPIIKILLAAALLSMFVELFNGHPKEKVPGAPILSAVLLALFGGAIATFLAIKWSDWIPSLMFGSAILVFLAGGLFSGAETGGKALWSIEGLAVMIAVILATGVAFAMEAKSDNEFAILNQQKDAIPVKVIRDGHVGKIGLEEIVIGDVVQLEAGDEIPADGRLLSSVELQIDQSLMTGESMPVKKHALAHTITEEGPDKYDCLYRGTQVVDGVGVMIISEIGDATYLGQIAKKLSADDGDDEEAEGAANTEEARVKQKLTMSKSETPLQIKLKNLAEVISKVGYIAAISIFFAFLVMRGIMGWGVEGGQGELLFTEETLGANLLKAGGALLQYFVYMVIIIVVAVPEGLPMSVTVSLALAVGKMTQANALVKQMVAVETIGSATVICSDKTGTLTQNKMTVVRVYGDGLTSDRGAAGWVLPDKEASWPRTGKAIDWLALNCAVNSTANLETKEGKVITVGNTTEGALLQWVEEAGISYKKLRHQFPELFQVHFNSERKRMTTVINYGGQIVVLVKGASEVMLAGTSMYLAADGSQKPWTADAKAAAETWVKDSAGQAMRTLGFAFAILPPGTPTEGEALKGMQEQIEHNLVFAGLLAIRDPLRDEVKAAVDQCRGAGIAVKMITGDNVETARAIGYDIGVVDRRDAPIDTDDAKVFTHPKFNALYSEWETLRGKAQRSPDEEKRFKSLEETLAGMTVLARARPLDKLKMVELLQSRQEVVGMTGDGTNDAPALKKADVGLAMGIAGTEVSKEASKIVLLDDSFATIVKAVNWGRSLYENIQRFVQFQLTINVSALSIAFIGPFLGIEPPFTVLQLLWINVIMDTFASIALCSEPPRASAMNQKPKRKDENIVTPSMFTTIMATAGFYIVVMLGILLAMKHGALFQREYEAADYAGKISPTQAGMFFSIYVFFQIFNMINCRSLTPTESGFSKLFVNPFFLGIVFAIAVGQILITEWEWMANIFKIGTLHWNEWLLVLLITPSVLIFGEVARQVRLAQMNKQTPGGAV
jgi:Ca2+-transporting ATPase